MSETIGTMCVYRLMASLFYSSIISWPANILLSSFSLCLCYWLVRNNDEKEKWTLRFWLAFPTGVWPCKFLYLLFISLIKVTHLWRPITKAKRRPPQSYGPAYHTNINRKRNLLRVHEIVRRSSFLLFFLIVMDHNPCDTTCWPYGQSMTKEKKDKKETLCENHFLMTAHKFLNFL